MWALTITGRRRTIQRPAGMEMSEQCSPAVGTHAAAIRGLRHGPMAALKGGGYTEAGVAGRGVLRPVSYAASTGDGRATKGIVASTPVPISDEEKAKVVLHDRAGAGAYGASREAAGHEARARLHEGEADPEN